MVAANASAVTNPPYELFPYVAESSDDPPLNYMKVCEPGRTGESEATYVVLGISFPRTYQAVNGFDGDLVVPAYIDGLPVRKINEAAFLASGVRSVTLPPTLREIGPRAFADCWSLTNITFSSGVATVGAGAFSNCTSLACLDFPKTLSRLGRGCFQGCVSLKDVYFRGNAPRLDGPDSSGKSHLGESIFRQWGYYGRFKVHIDRNTYGWVAPFEKGVPEKWPVDCGYMQAHETVAESWSASSDGAADASVSAQGSPAYALSNVPADRAIASVTVSGDMSLDAFVLADGKVYDSVLYINNVSASEARLSLPAGHVYKTLKGSDPLAVPPKSQSLLTVTRLAENVFLVSREDLSSLE